VDSGGQKTLAVVGAGRLGGALGRLLALAGYRVTAVVCRSRESARAAARFVGAGRPLTDPVAAARGADIVLLTTQDRVIGEVCRRIARGGGFGPSSLAVHCSGSQSLEILEPALAAGALRGVIHPLQSVPDRETGVRIIPGSRFRVEADAGALASVREMVRGAGGIELPLAGWTSDERSAALYHAGAVAVSNYLVALLDFGLDFYQALGADRAEALAAVLPLVKGTLGNVERLGTEGALTGPVARGDVGTIQGHLAAMRDRAPGLLPLYRELARRTVEVARRRGHPPPEALEDILRLLTGSEGVPSPPAERGRGGALPPPQGSFPSPPLHQPGSTRRGPCGSIGGDGLLRKRPKAAGR
jgi:predicted short-subunit dehydrogenase-like oxidoreductase (DUF2520 family)